MSFDQSSISEVVTRRVGSDLKLSWTSSASTGTWFQVYIGRRLTWFGTRRSVTLPWPQERVPIDIGAVLSTEVRTSFTSSLPAIPSNRAVLTWQGGTFLGDVAGYSIFCSSTAGVAVSYTAAIATVPAYQGAITDGYGLGTYSDGGYGRSPGSYAWTSGPLTSGVWTFAVVPFDSARNPCGSPATTAVTIASAPRPPASDARGNRLSYTYNPSTSVATLTWLPSPV